MKPQRLTARRLPVCLAALLFFLTPWAALAQIGPTPSPQGGYVSIPAPANPAAFGSSGGETTMVIEGYNGIQTAPISADLRQALMDDWQANGQSPSSSRRRSCRRRPDWPAPG
ncbi:MAG: hypothetical protein AAFY88_16610, partial [Acidobacteriota bacterium]